MRKVFAIAHLAVRNVIRSRLFASLVFLILLTALGLPMMVRGDGTLKGFTTVLLHYTLGATFMLFCVATTWGACAAAAVEIADRRIHLVLTKPVSHFQVWLGKWLGIILLDAALLLVAGSLVYGLLRWTTRSSVLAKEERVILCREVLRTRRAVASEEPDVAPEAERRLREMQARGEIPANVPPDYAVFLVRSRVQQEGRMVQPGQEKAWTLRLPARRPTHAEYALRFRFSSSRQVENAPVRAAWSLGPDGANARIVESLPNVPQEISIPPSAIPSDGILSIRYRNIEDRTPTTVVFDEDRGLEVLIAEGTIEGNMVRTLFILLCYLAFLTALGLTSGSLFSLPVSLFVSGAAMTALSIGRYVHSALTMGVFFVTHHGGIPEATLANRVFMALYKAADVVLAPLTSFHPIGLFAEGRLIPGDVPARAFLVLVVCGAGVLACIGVSVFRRREIALLSD